MNDTLTGSAFMLNLILEKFPNSQYKINNYEMLIKILHSFLYIAQVAGAVEYTNCISVTPPLWILH